VHLADRLAGAQKANLILDLPAPRAAVKDQHDALAEEDYDAPANGRHWHPACAREGDAVDLDRGPSTPRELNRIADPLDEEGVAAHTSSGERRTSSDPRLGEGRLKSIDLKAPRFILSKDVLLADLCRVWMKGDETDEVQTALRRAGSHRRKLRGAS